VVVSPVINASTRGMNYSCFYMDQIIGSPGDQVAKG